MFADIETIAHGIRHEAFKNGQRLKKISNTDSAERSAFFNKNSLGAGMATSLTNENRSKRNSINSFQNAITYMQTQEKLLKQSLHLIMEYMSVLSLMQMVVIMSLPSPISTSISVILLGTMLVLQKLMVFGKFH